MAIFDEHKVMYLTFWIVLKDRDRVAALQTQYPLGVNRAIYNAGPPPGGASVEFEAPFVGYTAPKFSAAPFSYAPFSHDSEGEPFPVDVATFSRHTGGFWGIGGTTVTYYWMGEFVLAEDPASPPKSDGTIPPVYGNIPVRRWVEGFEAPGLGPCEYAGSTGLFYARDASRHVGGLGLALRGASAQSTSIATNKYGLAATPDTWERLYIRLRQTPTTATVPFWQCHGSDASVNGWRLAITPGSQIAIYAANGADIGTLISTVGLLEEWTGRADHHAWVRLDIHVHYEAGLSHLTLYMRGLSVASFGSAYGATAHGTSRVGNALTLANDLYLDLDDWIGVAGAPPVIPSRDWLSGSSVRLLRATGFSTHHNGAAWTGDYRALLQHSVPGASPTVITSSTAQAALGADSDSAIVVDAEGQAIGVPALVVSNYSLRFTANGQLGYSLNGAAAVMATIAETVALGAHSVLHTVPGTGATFPDITPIELLYTKGNDAGAGSIAGLVAQVELCGKFGEEDFFASEIADIPKPVPAVIGQHNAPYPYSPWARQALAAPIGPYIVIGGTYVGNNTGQDLLFRAPVHFFWVRALGTSRQPFTWLSTLLVSKRNFALGADGKIVDADQDTEYAGAAGEDAQQQQYRIRLVGNDANLNANGVTYQYIAVCDPAMRFMLNLQVGEKATQVSDVVPLINPDYLPEWAFICPDTQSGSATPANYAKGPDQAAATIALFTGAAVANALTFALGELQTQAALHGLVGANPGPIAFSLWRRHDGNNDTGEPGVVNIGSYVGDGSASRTVNLAPASGKRPLWAIVYGEAGTTGYHRDPSHTGTNSTNNTPAETATGITGGGIDQFSVGSALNTNGVQYIYFVLFAGTTAGNNGWGVNGEYTPVEANSPTDGPWPDDPDEPTEPLPEPETPPPAGDDITTDLATNCVVPSTRLVNLALSRIGVSKQITSLALDESQEAYTARLHYGAVVEQVLRDFPWPFATKYATLAVVAGPTPAANADWVYAYRRPTDCVFERRLVVARTGALNPTPPPFQLSSDVTGGLILTNQAAAILEYSVRVPCPATAGDPLFRDAFVWKLAAALAAPLSRLATAQAEAQKMYGAAIEYARAVIRPGNPGAAPAASTLDTTAPQQAANLSLVNRALVRIGAQTIANLTTDQGREATAVRLIFEEELCSTLRDFPWAFSTRYANLVLVAGTSTVPVNADWQYSYRAPVSMTFARRIAGQAQQRRAYDPNPIKFRLGSDDTGQLIYCNEPATTDVPLVLEYTTRPAGAVAAADTLFRDAFAWRLAASLAPSLVQIDPASPEQIGRGPDEPGAPKERPINLAQLRKQAALQAWQMYQATLAQAKASNAKEQQQDPDGDASWITARN